MFFDLSKSSEFKLEPLVGPKINQRLKGSARLYVKEIKGENLPEELIGALVNFEIREKGLLMYLAKSDRRWVYAMNAQELVEVSLRGGEETYQPGWFTPMRLMLMLGISIRYARNYELRFDEYDVTPCILTLKSKGLNLTLETSGYNNYNLRHFISLIQHFIYG